MACRAVLPGVTVNVHRTAPVCASRSARVLSTCDQAASWPTAPSHCIVAWPTLAFCACLFLINQGSAYGWAIIGAESTVMLLSAGVLIRLRKEMVA